MRASILANNPLAITRELDGKYELLLEIKSKFPEIEAVANMDIDAILAELEAAQDFTGITVVSGPVTSWDGINKILTVATVKGDQGIQGIQGLQGATGPVGPIGPKGLTGAAGVNGTNGTNGINGTNGLNGMVPIMEFSLDAEGNLAYEVVGYEEGEVSDWVIPVQEW